MFFFLFSFEMSLLHMPFSIVITLLPCSTFRSRIVSSIVPFCFKYYSQIYWYSLHCFICCPFSSIKFCCSSPTLMYSVLPGFTSSFHLVYIHLSVYASCSLWPHNSGLLSGHRQHRVYSVDCLIVSPCFETSFSIRLVHVWGNLNSREEAASLFKLLKPLKLYTNN